MLNILHFYIILQNLFLVLCVFDKITTTQVVNAITYWKYYKEVNIKLEDVIDLDMTGDNYAYTFTTYKPYKVQIFIDSKKFIKAPKTLYNTILHEIGHYLRKSHNNDTKSIMNYSIKVDADTRLVIEDSHRRILGKKDICE